MNHFCNVLLGVVDIRSMYAILIVLLYICLSIIYTIAGKRVGAVIVLFPQLIVMVGLGIVYSVTGASLFQ